MNWQSLAGICALVCLGPWLGLMTLGFTAWAAFEIVVRVGDWRAGKRIQRDTARRQAVREALARRTCDGSKRWGEEQARATRGVSVYDSVMADLRARDAEIRFNLYPGETVEPLAPKGVDPDETQRWRADEAAGRTT